MPGPIVTVPPVVDLPPGSTTGGSSILPPYSITYAIPNFPQTWSGVQTYLPSTLVLSGTGGPHQVVMQETLNGPVTVRSLTVSDIASSSGPIVIFAAGQSNFVVSPSFSWTPNPNAQIWNNTVGTVGTGTSFTSLSSATVTLPQKFASDVANANPSRKVYLIVSAFDGQPISHWLVGTGAPDAYADGVANVAAALALIGATTINAFLWWQGEADANTYNPSYIANHATMMARWWTNSWFPQETPVIVHGIANSTIVASLGGGIPANYDKVNDLLIGVVNADPDKRRFVYAASLSSAAYWDAGNIGHMTGQGYFSAGKMSADVFLNGPGRNSLPNIIVDPFSGQIVMGNPTAPGNSTPITTHNANSVGATLPAPIGSTVRHTVGADVANAFDLVDVIAGFAGPVVRRANGTLASQSALAQDNTIFSAGAQGHNGSALTITDAAAFNLNAAEAWTSSANGTYGALLLTPQLSTSVATYHRWDPGSYTLNGTTSGTVKISAPAVAGSSVLTLPVATDTLIGKATTDTLTNKTFDSAGTGNVLKVSGVTISAGQYPGETGAGSATTGNVGERVDSSVLIGSAVSLTTGVTSNVTSISLSAGDWEVSGVVALIAGATTNVTSVFGSIGTTTGTLDVTTPGRFSNSVFGSSGLVPTGTAAFTQILPPTRFSLSGTTTVFLTARGNFTVSTLSAYGEIHAIRVR